MDFWVSLTDILVNVSIIAAAVVGVFKLRVFSLLSRRFRSEVECSHYTLPNGRIVFVVAEASAGPDATPRKTATT